MTVYHTHHIIPKHAGGSDNPENLIKLTVKEHANVHKKLYEEHNRWQDYVAWKALSGQITKAEAIKMAQSIGSKNRSKQSRQTAAEKRKITIDEKGYIPTWNTGLTKEQHPSLMEASIRAKEHQKQGLINCIGDQMRGKKFDDNHKQKLSDSAKNRKKVKCEHCEKEVIPQMYKRWHGINCSKSRRM